jgi:hypothetical protein
MDLNKYVNRPPLARVRNPFSICAGIFSRFAPFSHILRRSLLTTAGLSTGTLALPWSLNMKL